MSNPPTIGTTSYHQNNSLVMQFILYELIETFEITKTFDHYKRIIPSVPNKRIPKKSLESLKHLMHELTGLAGYNRKCMSILTWNLNDGILLKIKTYCDLFAQNLKSSEVCVASLPINAHSSWIHCLESIDILGEICQRQVFDATLVKACQDKLAQMLNCLESLSKTIKKLLLEFRDDENVLWFLLRHHHTLDQTFGHGMISQLVATMFPRGLLGLQKFLIKRYTSRGFQELIPAISRLINQITSVTV